MVASSLGSVAERRARLAARHRLSAPARAGSAAEAAESLIALHGTDPASVYLAVWARTGAVDPAAIDRALYDDQTLVRMLGMRRTMFVVPVGLAPVIQAACTDQIAERLRRRLVQTGATVVTIVATGWLCTLGAIPAILALMVAKHVLVAVLMMDLGFEQPPPK